MSILVVCLSVAVSWGGSSRPPFPSSSWVLGEGKEKDRPLILHVD